jgi:hypothetical protein
MPDEHDAVAFRGVDQPDGVPSEGVYGVVGDPIRLIAAVIPSLIRDP